MTLLPMLRADAGTKAFANLETGEPIQRISESLMTANAYLGANPIVEALSAGADMVITGRVADPSLTVAPCVAEFGWDANDHDRLAGATVAGHLIECGTQVTGGISTDWLRDSRSCQHRLSRGRGECRRELRRDQTT